MGHVDGQQASLSQLSVTNTIIITQQHQFA